MNRRIFLQLSGPSVVLGALLFAGSLVTMWSIQKLQRNLSAILADNVTSLEASQNLEISLRQFQYHSFLHFLDPRPDRLQLVEEDIRQFEQALAQAKANTTDHREVVLVQAIEEGYVRYQAELKARASEKSDVPSLLEWADRHPVRHLQRPCRELWQINKTLMEQTAVDTFTVGRQTQNAFLLLGIVGPISGLVVGYGVSRAWSRSFANLSVRLQDAHAHLDREVADLKLEFGPDWGSIERQLDRVVARIKQVADEMQRHRQEILRAEHLAAVGQLAAGIAHEIRNPLTGIKMLVEASLRPHASQPLAREDLEVIHREILRMEESVQALLNFARLPRPSIAAVELRDVIQQAWDLVRARAERQDVKHRLATSSRPIMAQVDANQIRTVLVNLYLNALDAMSSPGTIETELARTGSGQIAVRITDEGSGIKSEILERLFEPFATTKAHGTGLGLSLSRRIVEEHGGTMSAFNRPEGGACFTLALPAQGAGTDEG